MSVANMWFFDKKNDTTSLLNSIKTEKSGGGTRAQWRQLLDVAILNSRVAMEMKPPPKAVDDDPKVKKPDTLQPTRYFPTFLHIFFLVPYAHTSTLVHNHAGH